MVLVIIGSASIGSSNKNLMDVFCRQTAEDYDFMILEDLHTLPHFDPAMIDPVPVEIADILSKIEIAKGVVFCTPEYIFSIPARLKNLLEWCVATTIFMDKPVGIITASANGVQGHEQLKLILNTLGAKMNEDAQLLINGIKSKFDSQGQLLDPGIIQKLAQFAGGFKMLLEKDEN
ncbi:FMN reductase [Pedobacter ginsengisoli]|uniref:FMN reductase n=1 Tax=Pedobacter ginsengisoli TaxID=363852 RepID=A0A2D1U297_9SPHI|nr:NADPH-dependent FMN reductase [Pedobacter ginsengisoli]ATP55728.1 FMN reductase [Pedobacter ginsengisoli]